MIKNLKICMSGLIDFIYVRLINFKFYFMFIFNKEKFIFYFYICYGIIYVIFYIIKMLLGDLNDIDFIDFMKISDLLNQDNNDTSGPSNRPPGETPPDPGSAPKGNNHNSDKDGLLPYDPYDHQEYKKLAESLQEKRNALIEERVRFGSNSKSTTFGELGIDFTRRSPTKEEVKMIRTVLGSSIMGSSICNEIAIKRIGNYYPY
uniref:Uncharacterized protein n=1 Tax=Chrysoporthe deuterocubensis TaxID=764597 RepID=A0A191MWY1_9PEZI|nr:hypothetical protein [Chrysoporthe deuterocubensis]AMX22180.1 hypothetical protein [Chrysoporthe deuterocubensis]